MKILIEKVPQGIRLTIIADASKKPESFILNRADLETLTSLLNTAMRADSFKFEYQPG
jgi:hypothetical protein